MKNKRATEILGATPSRRALASLAAMTLTGLLVAGCGQKGPLMLPTASPVKASAPAADRTPALRNNNDQAAPR